MGGSSDLPFFYMLKYPYSIETILVSADKAEKVNYAYRSEEFDDTEYWGVANATIAKNNIPNPSSYQSALENPSSLPSTQLSYTLTETAVTGVHGMFQLFSRRIETIENQIYTGSYYVRKGIGVDAPDIIQLVFGIDQYANFNISTGTVTKESNCTAAITNEGSSWYRISITVQAEYTERNFVNIVFCDNDPDADRLPSYTGSTDADIFVWAAQFEIGSLTKYVKADEDPYGNKIRNPRALGSTPGVIGSGGVLPTNWGFYDASGQSVSTTNGIDIEVIGTGREGDIEYIDINFSGRATSTTEISLRAQGSSTIDANLGEKWKISSYIQAVDETDPPDSFELVSLCTGDQAEDTQINVLSVDPTSTLTKYEIDNIVVGRNINNINLLWLFQLSFNELYDFTYRFAIPSVVKKNLFFEEAKDFIRVDYTVDDDYIESLIDGSYDAFEAYTNRSLRNYTVNAIYEQFGVSLDLPYPPLPGGTISVSKVEYAFEDGTRNDVTSIWEQIGGSIRVLKPETIAPGYRLYITYSVVNPTIPKKVKTGLLKWIATNYEDRQNTADFNVYEVPNSSKHLWAEYRVMTL